MGERIAYTSTTLDEDNWEPVVSAPVEGSIRRISSGTSDQPESVCYEVLLVEGEGTVKLYWGDMTQCWVLRAVPPRSAAPLNSEEGAGEEEAVDDLLARISARRANLK